MLLRLHNLTQKDLLAPIFHAQGSSALVKNSSSSTPNPLTCHTGGGDWQNHTCQHEQAPNVSICTLLPPHNRVRCRSDYGSRSNGKVLLRFFLLPPPLLRPPLPRLALFS